MAARHPLNQVLRNRIVVGVVLIALIVFIILVYFFQVIEAAVALTGYGILDLEFAWTAAQASTILAAWGPTLIPLEIQGIYLDFAFIPSYVSLIAGLTLLLARRFTGHIKTLGLLFAFLPLFAGLLDIIENLHLLIMLQAPTIIIETVPFTASLCASLKFTLLFGTIGFFVVGLVTQAITTTLKRSSSEAVSTH